jgi:hypothetical protein
MAITNGANPLTSARGGQQQSLPKSQLALQSEWPLRVEMEQTVNEEVQDRPSDIATSTSSSLPTPA